MVINGFYENGAHIAIEKYLAMHEGTKAEINANVVNHNTDLNESKMRKIMNKVKSQRRVQEAKAKTQTKPKQGNAEKPVKLLYP